MLVRVGDDRFGPTLDLVSRKLEAKRPDEFWVADITYIAVTFRCVNHFLCESFFTTLECELLQKTKFKTRAEAELIVFEFIEGWKNPLRRQSSLDYYSPIQYEQKYQTAI